MKTYKNTVFLDNYYNLLNSLGREDKIKIIAKLSLSVAENSATKESSADRFFGAFLSTKNAEEIISEIRESRNFSRVVETF